MLEVEEIKPKYGCVGIEHVVSCILHLENRSGEGIICAAKQGLSSIATEQGRNDICEVMEKILLNDAGINYNFMLEKGELEKVSLTNTVTREICCNLHRILPLCHQHLSINM